MMPMLAGFVFAVFAASWNCGTAQEPRNIVPISPLAIRVFEFSQFVVVGSFSTNFWLTTL